MSEVIKSYLDRSKTDRRVWLIGIASLLFAILLGISATMNEVILNYLLLMIPTFIVNALIILYGCSQSTGVLSSFSMFGLCAINISAALTRASFGDAANTGFKIYFFMLAGIVAVVILAVLHRWLVKKPRHWQWIVPAILSLGFFAVCILMPEVNGARGWFYIGNQPIFQLTEAGKFFFVFFVGTLFNMKTFTDGSKLLISAVVTGISVLILLYCSELGTIMVMGIAYLCAIMITFESKGLKAFICICFAALIGIVALGYSNIHSNMKCWSCPNAECESVNGFDDKICIGCGVTKPAGGENFECAFCKFETWKEIELVKDDKGEVISRKTCPHCTNVFLLKGGLGTTFKKLYNRFAVAYNYDEVKGSNESYQIEQGFWAMKLGGLFGDKDSIMPIPNDDTDSVVAAMANRYGIIFVIVVLIAFLLVFLSIFEALSSLRIMALLTFVMQAVITYLGTLNMIPLTGIGVPLLTRGGTNLVLSYCLIYLILSSAKLKEVGKIEKK